MKQHSCYLGKNSLYKYNNKYFLNFATNTLKNLKFLKTAALINEYCLNMYENGIFETSLKEKSKIIITDKALQKLYKI